MTMLVVPIKLADKRDSGCNMQLPYSKPVIRRLIRMDVKVVGKPGILLAHYV